ncbi:MAG: hypothetical protein ACK553_14530 [Planctomycetota bacterium]
MIASLLSFVLAILKLEGYDRFHPSRGMILAAVLTMLASIAVWQLGVLLVRWLNRPSKSPQRLFRALCDRHQLTESERAMLQEIAGYGSYDPNFLFIDPDLWVAEPSTPDVERRKRDLFKKLFGELPTAV